MGGRVRAASRAALRAALRAAVVAHVTREWRGIGLGGETVMVVVVVVVKIIRKSELVD